MGTYTSDTGARAEREGTTPNQERGRRRLKLRVRRCITPSGKSQVPVPGTGMAYDFHSLVWESKQGDEWSEKLTVSWGTAIAQFSVT
jgi:hypothetical protein